MASQTGKHAWENPHPVIYKASNAPPHDSEDFQKATEIPKGLLSNNKHHHLEMEIIAGVENMQIWAICCKAGLNVALSSY